MLLIDGYNLLFVGARQRIRSEELEQARGRLLDELARYCDLCGLRARVVFDHTKGPPVFGYPVRTRHGPVEVYFTPKGVIADEEILGILEATSDSTAYTLVTSDRAIADPARRRQFRVQESLQFLREMEEAIRKADRGTDDAPQKGKGLAPGEVDYWMREFGIEEKDAP